MEKYIAFDVETPNAKNYRISSIGAAVIENGKIVETYSSLVNPETYFSSFNIELTGINKQKVKTHLILRVCGKNWSLYSKAVFL